MAAVKPRPLRLAALSQSGRLPRWTVYIPTSSTEQSVRCAFSSIFAAGSTAGADRRMARREMVAHLVRHTCASGGGERLSGVVWWTRRRLQGQRHLPCQGRADLPKQPLKLDSLFTAEPDPTWTTGAARTLPGCGWICSCSSHKTFRREHEPAHDIQRGSDPRQLGSS